jgi:hypothetical protein
MRSTPRRAPVPRRHRLALAVVPALLLLAPALAHADQAGDADPPAGQCQAAEQGCDAAAQPAGHLLGVDWGPNHDGWNVTVINDAGLGLSLLRPDPTDNVYYAPPYIGPGGTTTGIRGRQSLFGGPANMNFVYNGGEAAVGEVLTRITSDFSGNVTATCRAGYPGWGYLACEVVTAEANKPIVVRVYR